MTESYYRRILWTCIAEIYCSREPRQAKQRRAETSGDPGDTRGPERKARRTQTTQETTEAEGEGEGEGERERERYNIKG